MHDEGEGRGRTRTSVCVRTTVPAASDDDVTGGHIRPWSRPVAWGRADQGPARRSAWVLRGGRASRRGGRARARDPRPARSTSASRSSTTPHVVRDLEAKGAVFVEEETEVPQGAVVVLSAHGVAPEVYANAERRGLTVLDATCPLVTKVHLEARRFADHGRTIVLIGHAGHEEVVGTTGQAPTGRSWSRTSTRRARSRCPTPRTSLPHADHAVGRRDQRDRRGAPRTVPLDPGTAARGHLLRDPEPPGRDQGGRAPLRRRARHRLGQLVELQPPGRGRPRPRDPGLPGRRRDRGRPGVARGRRGGRPHERGVGARATRRPAARLAGARRARPRSRSFASPRSTCGSPTCASETTRPVDRRGSVSSRPRTGRSSS